MHAFIITLFYSSVILAASSSSIILSGNTRWPYFCQCSGCMSYGFSRCHPRSRVSGFLCIYYRGLGCMGRVLNTGGQTVHH